MLYRMEYSSEFKYDAQQGTSNVEFTTNTAITAKLCACGATRKLFMLASGLMQSSLLLKYT